MISFHFSDMKQLRNLGQAREAELSGKAVFSFELFQARDILPHQAIVDFQFFSLRLGAVTVDKQIDSPAGDFFSNCFSDHFLERQILSRYPQLQIQVAVIETADLHRHLCPRNILRCFAISRHALHLSRSSITFLILAAATATVPISSPTKPAATLASTAASSKPAPLAKAKAHIATTVSPAPVTSKTSLGSVGKCFGARRRRNRLMPSAPRVISTAWARHFRTSFLPAASRDISSWIAIPDASLASVLLGVIKV